jgi:hypothetical protein
MQSLFAAHVSTDVLFGWGLAVLLVWSLIVVEAYKLYTRESIRSAPAQRHWRFLHREKTEPPSVTHP